MYDDDIEKAYSNVFMGLNSITDRKKTKKDLCVLAMMYKLGLGTEKNEDMYLKLLPEDSSWINDWMDRFVGNIDD